MQVPNFDARLLFKRTFRALFFVNMDQGRLKNLVEWFQRLCLNHIEIILAHLRHSNYYIDLIDRSLFATRLTFNFLTISCLWFFSSIKYVFCYSLCNHKKVLLSLKVWFYVLPKFLANSFFWLQLSFERSNLVYLLKFNWFKQNKVVHSKLNFRPKSCFLEI